ncbi:hypothetical protein BH10PLA1_BH10PLA1_04550 [soil metagenome]
MSNTHNETTCESGAENLLAELTRRQYLRPHQPLNMTLAQLAICSTATEQSVRWLKLDDSRSIGRFRAADLARLARCIQRILDQAKSRQSLVPQTV